MTPEEEIERIKKDFASHWPKIENYPSIKEAIASKNPVRLGELAAMLTYGNQPAKEDLAREEEGYKYYLAYKERERLVRQKDSN